MWFYGRSSKMLRFTFCCIMYFVILSLQCSTVSSQTSTMVIPLNKTTTAENKELYAQFVNVTKLSTLQITFENVNKNVSFIILQAHSHLYSFTMYNNTFTSGSYVTGRNIGMYSSVKPKIDTFYISNQNEDTDLMLYISVHGYEEKYSIPGGCNLECCVPIPPSLEVVPHEHDYVTVNAPGPMSSGDWECKKMSMVVFFKLYLPERDFSADTYFSSLKKMMTYDAIKIYGKLVPQTSYNGNTRRILSMYPGTGVFYVAVTGTLTETEIIDPSVYVPAHYYGCEPLNERCELIDDWLSQILCALLFFVGTFVCFFGHRFLKTEMFLFGFSSGLIVTYIFISLSAELDRPELLGASILCGVLVGAIWLTYWWLYAIPVVAVLLPTLNMGFLFASLLLYRVIPDNSDVYMNDKNFWSLFIITLLLTSMLMLFTTFLSNILSCAVLGAYAVVYSIDMYVGSNLKFIVVDVIRRAVVPMFNKAVVDPPFQWQDGVLTGVWISLSLTGFCFQLYDSQGKAPFPPAPRSTRSVVPEVPIVSYGATRLTNTRRQAGSVLRRMFGRLPIGQPTTVSTDETTPLVM